MQVFAPRSRQITIPTPHHPVFLWAGCFSCHPANSVSALKVQCNAQNIITELSHWVWCVCGRHLSVALVVDLSKPDELWLTVDRWLDVLRARVTAVIRDAHNADPSIKDKLQQSSWQRVGEEHEVVTELWFLTPESWSLDVFRLSSESCS